MVVVRATVIKIARAIIILKPAFLVVPSPGRWSRRQEMAESWWNDRREVREREREREMRRERMRERKRERETGERAVRGGHR